MTNDNSISGPLGIWTWPILNTIIQISGNNKSESSGSKVETAKVIRDSNGEIQEVIVIKE